jgi:hypothetical protein
MPCTSQELIWCFSNHETAKFGRSSLCPFDECVARRIRVDWKLLNASLLPSVQITRQVSLEIVLFHQPMTLTARNTHQALRLVKPYRFVHCTARSGFKPTCTGRRRSDCPTKFATGRRLGHFISTSLGLHVTNLLRIRSTRRPLSAGGTHAAFKASGSEKKRFSSTATRPNFEQLFLAGARPSNPNLFGFRLSMTRSRAAAGDFSSKIPADLNRILPAGGESVRRFRPPASARPLSTGRFRLFPSIAAHPQTERTFARGNRNAVRLPLGSNTISCSQSTPARTSLGDSMLQTSEFGRQKAAPLREERAVRAASGTRSGGALLTCSSAGRQHAAGARKALRRRREWLFRPLNATRFAYRAAGVSLKS